MKLEKGLLFSDRYLLVEALGIGASAEVWLAKDTKTGIDVALKIYAPAMGLDDAGLNVFAREFALVVNVDHKNLLKPLYYDSCGRIPYLVLPYCKNGNIMKLAGKFSEHDAWRLLRDVASGLAWLHSMNPPIIHQDIKPDNIMIGDNGEFRITDFGISTHLRSTLRKSMSSAFRSAGTIAYMAPERFGKDNTPIMASDIYSLGATVFEMLTGDAPFGDNGGLVQKGGAEIPYINGNYSEQLKKVVEQCLKVNPWERPTAERLEQYAVAGLEGRRIDFVDKMPPIPPKIPVSKVERRSIADDEPIADNVPIVDGDSHRRKKIYGYIIGVVVLMAIAVYALSGVVDGIVSGMLDDGNSQEAYVDSINDSFTEEPVDTLIIENQQPVVPEKDRREKIEGRKSKTDVVADRETNYEQKEERRKNSVAESSYKEDKPNHFEDTYSKQPMRKKPEREEVFKAVEQMPQFPGGDAALMKYISNNIKYPTIAMENNVQGRVIVQFIVTKTGAIGDVKVVRSVDPYLDREAVRLCKSLPKFIPGRMNGEVVNVWYTLPINFRLTGN